MTSRLRGAWATRKAWPLLAGMAGGEVLLSGCTQGSAAGTLVGRYTVKGVLVENTCGQAGLPTVNPLEFIVELREDQGVGYWVPSESPRNTGSLDDDGSFRFIVSQTQVVNQPANGARNLEPQDFVTLNPDFDLQQPRACALTTREIVAGSIQRRQSPDGGVSVSAVRSGDAGTSDLAGDDDLLAENTIEVSPSAGSDCNRALAALGGTFLALPCQARYVLHGSLSPLE